MAIVNLLAQIGTSESIKIYQNFEQLIHDFSFEKFSKSAMNYDITELTNINQKLLQILSFAHISSRIKEIGINYNISEKFWEICKHNINFIHEIKDWCAIFYDEFRYKNAPQDLEFLQKTVELLPQDTSQENSWQIWLDEIKKNSERKGKELFMPIRLALTGKEHGPELKYAINLLSRDEIIARLKFQ
jgi:glutamyl-tRNA synthetase